MKDYNTWFDQQLYNFGLVI